MVNSSQRPEHDQDAVVVLLPRVIEYSNAPSIRSQLSAAFASGKVVLADLSMTISCDCEGAFSLAQAHRAAAAKGAELWLVGVSAGVKRVLVMLGLDDLLPIYPSLEAAHRYDVVER